jgi:hypothetical protein
MSSTSSLPPFVKWGDYKSKDADKPDMLEIKVLDAEPFATEYSTNARVEIKDGQTWTEAILPIKSHSSNNASLLTKWTDLLKKGKIKKGSVCTIRTHLGISKNDNPIRRFAISVR